MDLERYTSCYFSSFHTLSVLILTIHSWTGAEEGSNWKEPHYVVHPVSI